MRFLIVVFSFLFFSFNAFAVDYYWTVGGSTNGTQYSTAEAVCKVLTGQAGFVYKQTNFYVDSGARCIATVVSNGTAIDRGYATRYGAGCTLPNVYDTVLRSCLPPPPDLCKQAQGASTSYTVKTVLGSEPPTTIDVNGCLATFGGVIVCGNNTKGEATCTGIATITGDKTLASSPTAGEGEQCSGDDCLKDAPQPTTEEKPCTLIVDPVSGSKTCVSLFSSEKPGTSKCSESGGSWVCVETPKSELIKKETETLIEEISNIDGSVDQKKTDTTDLTTCKGINNCTTKTSVTTSTGGRNPDGSDKGSTSTCVGSTCGSPSAISDEVAESEEEEEAPPSPVVDELVKPSEKGNFDDAAQEWDQKIADARDELKVKSEQIGDLFSPIAALNLSSGSASLPCTESFTVMGQTTSICLGRYEAQLLPLALAILFICALIALFIVFKPGD